MAHYFFRLILALCSLASIQAFAAPIVISSYDMTNVQLDGAGNWHHQYNGKIEATGKNSVYQGNALYNYTGGSGTLNDGLIGTSASNTQLLIRSDNSVITLHLGTSAAIETLELFSFLSGNNGIPGGMTNLDITINDTKVNLASIGFGNPSSWNGGPHERISLLGTALEGLVTDTIILSNFTGDWAFGISEIAVYGTEAIASSHVPEPAQYALMMMGLFGLGLVQHRRTRKRVQTLPC